MSFDDVGYLVQEELILREAERVRAQEKADWEDRALVESIEAEEAYWEGVFTQSSEHYLSRQVWQ